MVGHAVVRLASGSTEPASMSAWGLLLIAIGLLLRAMRFRATSAKAEASPRAAAHTLEAAVGIAVTKYLRTGRSSISP